MAAEEVELYNFTYATAELVNPLRCCGDWVRGFFCGEGKSWRRKWR